MSRHGAARGGAGRGWTWLPQRLRTTGAAGQRPPVRRVEMRVGSRRSHDARFRHRSPLALQHLRDRLEKRTTVIGREWLRRVHNGGHLIVDEGERLRHSAGSIGCESSDAGRMLDVFRLHHGFEETTLPRPPGRGFRDYSMIETHHLKANDFIIEAWEPMDRFPRDGSVVEVEDDEGRVRLAAWR
jgi:hypothetical protein